MGSHNGESPKYYLGATNLEEHVRICTFCSGEGFEFWFTSWLNLSALCRPDPNCAIGEDGHYVWSRRWGRQFIRCAPPTGGLHLDRNGIARADAAHGTCALPHTHLPPGIRVIRADSDSIFCVTPLLFACAPVLAYDASFGPWITGFVGWGDGGEV
jgi:hypothetical protein